MCFTAQDSGVSLTKRFGEKWGSQLLYQRRQAATTPSTDQMEGMVISSAKEQRARESFLSKRGSGQPAANPTPEDDSSYTNTSSSRAGGFSTAATQPTPGWQSAWNTTTNDGGQHQQSGGSFQSNWLPEGSRGADSEVASVGHCLDKAGAEPGGAVAGLRQPKNEKKWSENGQKGWPKKMVRKWSENTFISIFNNSVIYYIFHEWFKKKRKSKKTLIGTEFIRRLHLLPFPGFPPHFHSRCLPHYQARRCRRLRP
jgi:hypothetical protein